MKEAILYVCDVCDFFCEKSTGRNQWRGTTRNDSCVMTLVTLALSTHWLGNVVVASVWCTSPWKMLLWHLSGVTGFEKRCSVISLADMDLENVAMTCILL